MVATTAQSVRLVIDGQTHTGPGVEAVRPVLMSLARELRNARTARDDSAEQQRMVKARMKLGAALLQLEPQVAYGVWGRVLEEIAAESRLSKHTIKRAIRIAAHLATTEGDVDVAKVLQARRVLAKLRPDKARPVQNPEILVRARTKISGLCEGVEDVGQTGGPVQNPDNLVRARTKISGFRTGSGVGVEDDAAERDTWNSSEAAVLSLRDAEELARAASGDMEPLPVIEIESSFTVGEQLTFASLARDVEERLQGVVAAVVAHHAEEAAARALAAKLRAAAESIERELMDGGAGGAEGSKSPARATEGHTRVG